METFILRDCIRLRESLVKMECQRKMTELELDRLVLDDVVPHPSICKHLAEYSVNLRLNRIEKFKNELQHYDIEIKFIKAKLSEKLATLPGKPSETPA